MVLSHQFLPMQEVFNELSRLLAAAVLVLFGAVYTYRYDDLLCRSKALASAMRPVRHVQRADGSEMVLLSRLSQR